MSEDESRATPFGQNKGEITVCKKSTPEPFRVVPIFENLVEYDQDRIIEEQAEIAWQKKLAAISSNPETAHITAYEEQFEFDFKKGYKQGREETKVKIAKNMLKDDLTVGYISYYTSLPTETILSFKSELQMGLIISEVLYHQQIVRKI